MSRLKTCAGLLVAAAIYLSLGFSGIRFGLPDQGHILSYNCDETNWLEGLSLIRPRLGEFNPHPTFHHPTLYLGVYGAALGAAHVVGWVPSFDKEKLRERPELFARVYLVGRFLQIIFGLLILGVVWAVGRSVFGGAVGTIAALFLAVTPAFVAASHFSQASVPVTLLATLSVGTLAVGLHREKWDDRFLTLSAFFAGLAISTKYSTFALAVPVGLAALKSSSKIKGALLAVLSTGAGFFLASPFALLAPHAFFEGFKYHMWANQLPVEGLRSLIYPLQIPFLYALGPALFFLSLIAVLYVLFRRKGPSTWILLIWIAAFYAGTVRVGYIGSPARVLIALPVVALVIGIFFDDLFKRFPIVTPVRIGVIAGLLAISAVPSLAIINLRRTPPPQKVASAWIEENIPRTARWGFVRRAYWWSPDVLYKSKFFPERMQQPYRTVILNYSKAEAERLRPDYILVSGVEKNFCTEPGSVPDLSYCDEFFSYLNEGKDYRLVKTFPREVKVDGWTWHRPETKLNSDDDLRVTELTIYERLPGSKSTINPASSKPS